MGLPFFPSFVGAARQADHAKPIISKAVSLLFHSVSDTVSALWRRTHAGHSPAIMQYIYIVTNTTRMGKTKCAQQPENEEWPQQQTKVFFDRFSQDSALATDHILFHPSATCQRFSSRPASHVPFWIQHKDTGKVCVSCGVFSYPRYLRTSN